MFFIGCEIEWLKDNQMIIINIKWKLQIWSGYGRSSERNRSGEILYNKVLVYINNTLSCHKGRAYINIPAGLNNQVILVEMWKKQAWNMTGIDIPALAVYYSGRSAFFMMVYAWLCGPCVTWNIVFKMIMRDYAMSKDHQPGQEDHVCFYFCSFPQSMKFLQK